MSKQLVSGKHRLRNTYWSLVGAASATILSVQPVMAETIWDRFSTIMRDIYGQLVGISTIVAVTVAAIALLVRMVSRNQRAVDEATSWLKRVVVTWIMEGCVMGITIKDVAAAAGTSVSTVSKVINGHYSISEETAARVRRVMQELNYYPNASAQSFARGTTKTIAVLANLAPNTAFQNPHMFEMIAGLEESLSARGYRLQLRGVDPATAYEVAKEVIYRQSADALAIHVSVIAYPLSGLLTKSHFPHIVLGAPNFESQVCWIDNNNVYSGTVAAAYLLSRGYRKIAFIGGQYYDFGSLHRLQGVKQELENAGLQLEDQYIWLGESTRADSFLMTMKLLDHKILPDAIICANNYIAMGCVDALCRKNIRIPQDIGIVAFDDYPLSQVIEPQLTIVDINVRDLGRQAGKLIIDIIKHPNKQIQTYVTTSNIVERKSTRRTNQT